MSLFSLFFPLAHLFAQDSKNSSLISSTKLALTPSPLSRNWLRALAEPLPLLTTTMTSPPLLTLSLNNFRLVKTKAKNPNIPKHNLSFIFLPIFFRRRVRQLPLECHFTKHSKPERNLQEAFQRRKIRFRTLSVSVWPLIFQQFSSNKTFEIQKIEEAIAFLSFFSIIGYFFRVPKSPTFFSRNFLESKSLERWSKLS